MATARGTDPTGLPQADATTLVDRGELELRVQEMYRSVADEPSAPRHFRIGRDLALQLGYPEALLETVPPGRSPGHGTCLCALGVDEGQRRPGHRILAAPTARRSSPGWR